MSLTRRKVLALLGVSATTVLAGCGGGGGDNPPSTRFVSLLNLNPEFQSSDVTFGSITVGAGLPFPALTQRFEVEFGTYTVAVRDRMSGLVQNFDTVVIDDNSPSLLVFYRHFGSSRLGSSPPGIINYFDSNVALTSTFWTMPATRNSRLCPSKPVCRSARAASIACCGFSRLEAPSPSSTQGCNDDPIRF